MSGYAGLLGALGLASGVTALLVRSLSRLAVRIDLVDYPSERKLHGEAVPLVGGIAMFCGFVLGLLTLPIGLFPLRSFFAAAGILVVVGVLDDLSELSSAARFAAQIVAALLMVYWGGIELATLGDIGWHGGPINLGIWAIPMTVFSTVGVINAVNMADGMDGLAGTLVLVALGGLAVVALSAGMTLEVSVLVPVAGAVAAFLAFNLGVVGRQRVFMGDAGAMFLGFALTWFCVRLSEGPRPAMPPVLALWLLLVPLYDTVWRLLHRAAQGRSPFGSDYGHLHHLLQMTGLSARQTWAVLSIASLTAAAGGLYGWRSGVPEATLFHWFMGLFLIYCGYLGYAWRVRRLFGWAIDRRKHSSGRGPRLAPAAGGSDAQGDARRGKPERRHSSDG